MEAFVLWIPVRCLRWNFSFNFVNFQDLSIKWPRILFSVPFIQNLPPLHPVAGLRLCSNTFRSLDYHPLFQCPGEEERNIPDGLHLGNCPAVFVLFLILVFVIKHS